jgi:hypothetical protein
MSGQLHCPVALPPGKEPPIPIGYEVGWTAEPAWTIWRQYRNSNSDPSDVESVTSCYTDCTTACHLAANIGSELEVVTACKTLVEPIAFRNVSNGVPQAADNVLLHSRVKGRWFHYHPLVRCSLKRCCLYVELTPLAGHLKGLTVPLVLTQIT